MRIQAVFLAFVALVALFSQHALAETCSSVTITTSTASSTLTTGTSAVISSTTTASGSSCTADIRLVSTGQATSSSLTVSDPAAGYHQGVSVSTSGTSKSFTVTAGTADAYNYYVTAGSSQSTTKTITYVNPSTITIAGFPTTVTTNSSGNSFTLQLTLTNPQASDITTSYELSQSGSAFTFAGDPTSSSSTTVSASSSRILQWTVTLASSWSGTQTISFQLGDNAGAFTSAVTYPVATATPSPTATADGSGSQGNSNNQPTPPTATPVPSTPTPTTSSPTPTVLTLPPETGVESISQEDIAESESLNEDTVNRLITQVENLMKQVEAQGGNTLDAQQLIATARQHMEEGNYQAAYEAVLEARDNLEAQLRDYSDVPGLGFQSRSNIFMFIVVFVLLIGGVIGYYKMAKKNPKKLK